MQQQFSTPQHDQYGNQQQIAQPMVLCPIQYVYETPMLVQPSIQEEQVQQPYLLNVQNPPPWINRQNVVYLQQNLPFYPNMMTNQLYHQQVNYIPQMVVPHEIRQIQMPVQTPELEKSPVLSQMLKTQIPRPVTQNQQVQTDISSRPNRPQVITINPMQQRLQNPRPRQEIPNHIRTKIPSSISVKTIYRPILPRPMRPYENFYYNNFVFPEQNTELQTVQNVKVEKKFKNEECQTVVTNKVNNEPDKIKFNQVNPRVNQNEVIQVNPRVNQNEVIQVNSRVNQNEINQVNPRANQNEVKVEAKIERPTPVAMETQTEEKLLRGTVFIQARGRVLEKEVVINSLKRTLDDRLQMNMAKNQINNNITNNVNNNINVNTVESPKKIIKVETTQTNLQNNANFNVPVEQIQMTVPQNMNAIQIPLNVSNKDIAEAKVTKTTNLELNANAKATELNNLKTQLTNIEQKDNKYQNKSPEENIEITKEIIKPDQIKTPKVKEPNKEALKAENICKEEVKIKDRLKEEKVVVLTHVLDGHIIQESNVAFPIQKLSKEAEKDKTSQKISPKSVDIKKHDVIPHLPLSYERLTKNMEDTESTDIDTDSPFRNVKKSVVRSWTTEKLADHLAKHIDWKETASKLLDQEIDGESLLLVNKEQLVIIGVCETHAEVINSFVSNN